MTRCDACGDEILFPYRCWYCNGYYCFDHKLPESHKCKGSVVRHKTGVFQEKSLKHAKSQGQNQAQPGHDLKRPITRQMEMFRLAFSLAKWANDRGVSTLRIEEVESFLLGRKINAPSWAKKLLFRFGCSQLQKLHTNEKIDSFFNMRSRPEIAGQKLYRVIGNHVRIGACSVCHRDSKRWNKPGEMGVRYDVPLHVVRVTNVGNGNEQWRCSTCANSTDGAVASYLFRRDIELRDNLHRAYNLRQIILNELQRTGSAKPRHIESRSWGNWEQHCSKCGQRVDGNGFLCPKCYELYCYDCVCGGSLRSGFRRVTHKNGVLGVKYTCPECEVELEPLRYCLTRVK